MSTSRRLRRVLPATAWGDRVFARYQFRRACGRDPQTPPQGLSDQLFALRTGGATRDPLVQMVTDKEYVKLYVRAVLGDGYVNPTYRILRSRAELSEYSPDRIPCVLKPTHASGEVMICRDPEAGLDRGRLHAWLDMDYYRRSREPQYRNLSSKIVVEEFFSPDGASVPDDYKIWCACGVAVMVQVDSGRFTQPTRNLYDTSWNRIPARIKFPNREGDDPKPPLLAEMLAAAQRLSAPFPFMRVDLYASDTEFRVGELTFLPRGGAARQIEPEQMDRELGRRLFGPAAGCRARRGARPEVASAAAGGSGRPRGESRSRG